jgi:pimeloyl-ACP methyl ester carboxylesterase
MPILQHKKIEVMQIIVQKTPISSFVKFKQMYLRFLFLILYLIMADNISAQHTYGSKYFGDALVTYILAKNKTETATIVMVPGLNLTSYIFSNTPDNRKGWADMFADKGYNVYMVNDPKHDFATGGIVSPFAVPSNGKASTSGAVQAWQSDIWERWGFGPSQGNPYANAKFPTDSFAAFARNYPYVGTSSQGFDKAIEAVIDSIGGKVWILSHSAGTQPAVIAATTKKAKMNGMILIEPAGPPNSSNFPALNGLHMFGVYGDYITSRNQASRKTATETAATLFKNAGGIAGVVSMPDDSLVYGNSHLMMQDKNNKNIFDIIELWLRQFQPQVPPVLGNIPNQNGTVGASFNLALRPYVTITNGDSILNYSLSGTLPAGLSLNSNTGIISGTPSAVETKRLIATCTDNDGVSNKDTFEITTTATSSSQIPPILNNIPNQNGTIGTNFNLALRPYVTITNGDSILNYTLSGTLPAGLSFSTSTGIISGTLTKVETKTMIATCTDNDGVSNSVEFDIAIGSLGIPPVLGNIPLKIGVVGTNFDLALRHYVTITNGDSILNYTLSGTLPAGLSFNASTGIISGIATTVETKIMMATCTDKDGISNSSEFYLITGSPLNSSIQSEANSILIYPNPVSNFLFINNQNVITDFSIYNIIGQKMEITMVDNQINVSNLTNGIYFLSFTDQTGKNYTTKFTKD